jgi:hypothetical protein
MVQVDFCYIQAKALMYISSVALLASLRVLASTENAQWGSTSVGHGGKTKHENRPLAGPQNLNHFASHI